MSWIDVSSARRVIARAVLLMLLAMPAVASAAVYPCTEAGLNSGLAAGGVVQFSCASATTIPISGTKVVTTPVDIDGGDRVTFRGNAGYVLFATNASATFRNLAITGANVVTLGSVLSCGAGTTCTLDRTTIDGNNSGAGGAVLYTNGGTIAVTHSTISNGDGNALMGDGGALSLTSSTISGMFRGVVARNGTTATVRHSTIVGGNTGVHPVDASDAISIGHVLFADNVSDVSAAVTSVGYNVIEDAFAGAHATDVVGIPARVAVLADNGGPTQTVAPLACSPAINAGNPTASLTTDQRGTGFPRVRQSRQDIGAFESNLTPLPCITTQPQPRTVFSGQTLTLSVGAITGRGTLTYQWRRGGVPISGATSATYTKVAAVADAGSYDVVVGNGSGTVTSNAVMVTVHGAPAITGQPQPRTVFAGQSFTLMVTASGTSLTYQWYRGANPIPGATSATYTKTAVVSDAGSYRVVVTNPAGSATSNAVTVTVNGPPAITAQPQDQMVFEGETLALSVTATGAGLTYQWRRNGSPITGATAATYTKAAAPMDAGTYTVVVSNPAGSVTSTSAMVTVFEPPTITSHPVDVAIFEGGTFTLSVTATGTALSYQWRRAGTPIAGATAATYTKAAATASDAGDYDVVVTNDAGSVTSDPAHVSIAGPPQVTAHPDGVALFVGQALMLTLAATGKELSYQWRHEGTPIAGATSAALSIAAVALADAGGYDCVVTNPAGSATSESAPVTVHGAPAITRHPTRVQLIEGTSYELVVEATGMSLSYQWHRDGEAIAGATGATFGISEASVEDEGEYHVVVTNPAGSVTSDTAVVSVRPPADDGGCGCSHGAPTGSNLLFVVVLAGLVLRRRRP